MYYVLSSHNKAGTIYQYGHGHTSFSAYMKYRAYSGGVVITFKHYGGNKLSAIRHFECKWLSRINLS